MKKPKMAVFKDYVNAIDVEVGHWFVKVERKEEFQIMNNEEFKKTWEKI